MQINDWRWVASWKNLSSYSYWKSGKTGFGCLPLHQCMNTRAMIINAPSYTWSADDKNKEYPYICVSSCALGYYWQKRAKKCVKIVYEDTEQLSHADASIVCAKDNARLLSIDSCAQFKGLSVDLWYWNADALAKYWVGWYAEGFHVYNDNKRVSSAGNVSLNSKSEIGIDVTGSSTCTNNFKIPN